MRRALSDGSKSSRSVHTDRCYARCGRSGNTPTSETGVAGSTPSARIFAITELKSAAVCASAIGLASRFTARPLTTSGNSGGSAGTQAADLLARDLARDAAVEQQHDQRHLVGIRGTGDFLRRHAGAERQAVDAFGEQQELEDREAELVGIVGRRREQDVPRVARRTDEARHVAQQALREVGEAQLLEVLHVAAHDALVHRFVERNERLLEELAQALADQELRQVVLHFADRDAATEACTAVSISDGSGDGSSTARPSIDCSAESASGTTAPARQPSDRSCLMSLRRAT